MKERESEKIIQKRNSSKRCHCKVGHELSSKICHEKGGHQISKQSHCKKGHELSNKKCHCKGGHEPSSKRCNCLGNHEQSNKKCNCKGKHEIIKRYCKKGHVINKRYCKKGHELISKRCHCKGRHVLTHMTSAVRKLQFELTVHHSLDLLHRNSVLRKADMYKKSLEECKAYHNKLYCLLHRVSYKIQVYTKNILSKEEQLADLLIYLKGFHLRLRAKLTSIKCLWTKMYRCILEYEVEKAKADRLQRNLREKLSKDMGVNTYPDCSDKKEVRMVQEEVLDIVHNSLNKAGSNLNLASVGSQTEFLTDHFKKDVGTSTYVSYADKCGDQNCVCAKGSWVYQQNIELQGLVVQQNKRIHELTKKSLELTDLLGRMKELNMLEQSMNVTARSKAPKENYCGQTTDFKDNTEKDANRKDVTICIKLMSDKIRQLKVQDSNAKTSCLDKSEEDKTNTKDDFIVQEVSKSEEFETNHNAYKHNEYENAASNGTIKDTQNIEKLPSATNIVDSSNSYVIEKPDATISKKVEHDDPFLMHLNKLFSLENCHNIDIQNYRTEVKEVEKEREQLDNDLSALIFTEKEEPRKLESDSVLDFIHKKSFLKNDSFYPLSDTALSSMYGSNKHTNFNRITSREKESKFNPRTELANERIGECGKCSGTFVLSYSDPGCRTENLCTPDRRCTPSLEERIYPGHLVNSHRVRLCNGCGNALKVSTCSNPPSFNSKNLNDHSVVYSNKPSTGYGPALLPDSICVNCQSGQVTQHSSTMESQFKDCIQKSDKCYKDVSTQVCCESKVNKKYAPTVEDISLTSEFSVSNPATLLLHRNSFSKLDQIDNRSLENHISVKKGQCLPHKHREKYSQATHFSKPVITENFFPSISNNTDNSLDFSNFPKNIGSFNDLKNYSKEPKSSDSSGTSDEEKVVYKTLSQNTDSFEEPKLPRNTTRSKCYKANIKQELIDRLLESQTVYNSEQARRKRKKRIFRVSTAPNCPTILEMPPDEMYASSVEEETPKEIKHPVKKPQKKNVSTKPFLLLQPNYESSISSNGDNEGPSSDQYHDDTAETYIW